MGRFTILVTFRTLIATFSVFKKIKFLFGKTNFFFARKIKIWTFWEFFLFRSHSPTNMLYLAKFKILKIFFQKTYFFRNYPKIRTFWEVLLFQSHYTTNLLLLPIFKIFIFFKKSVTSLRKKMNALRNPKLSVAFYDIFPIFNDFQKLMFFLEKLILFFY